MKILPCPFCGIQPKTSGSGEGQRGLMIECITTECVRPHVSYYQHEASTAAWNRRDGRNEIGPMAQLPKIDSEGLRAAKRETAKNLWRSKLAVDDAMIKRAMKTYGVTPLSDPDWMRVVLTAALKSE